MQATLIRTDNITHPQWVRMVVGSAKQALMEYWDKSEFTPGMAYAFEQAAAELSNLGFTAEADTLMTLAGRTYPPLDRLVPLQKCMAQLTI